MTPSPRLVQVGLWVLCLTVAIIRLHEARTAFDDPADTPPPQRRADGNAGHTYIDFGGQWMMGRQVNLGHERELYHRDRHWELAYAVYPRSDEPPERRANAFPKHLRDPALGNGEIRHDAEQMMYWFMGEDSLRWKDAAVTVGLLFLTDGTTSNPFTPTVYAALAREKLTPEVVAEITRPAIGGPLYPPVHAFLYAPIALDPEPRQAYRTFQWLSVALTFGAGAGLSAITRGRISWPVASTAVFLFPGYRAGLDLGQNHVFTLVILAWGWAFAVRGSERLGGAVWGLLAFKPVWGATFFLLPLLLRRWRFCAAMVFVGISLCLATLPFVGVQSWFEWLAVGKEASATYEVNKNWIQLSRDLGGIPRRLLVDFTQPEAERKSPLASAIGWSMWLIVLAATVGIYHARANRRLRTGLGAGFLALGSYLVCYRFIYYDSLLVLLPLAILFAEPRIVRRNGVAWPAASFPVAVVGFLYLIENVLAYLRWQVWVPLGKTSRITFDFGPDCPWDTLLLLAVWAWCGWRLLRYGDPVPSHAA